MVSKKKSSDTSFNGFMMRLQGDESIVAERSTGN